MNTPSGRPLEPWQVLQSRVVFQQQPWITISIQEIRLPDGKVVSDYYKVQMQEYVVVFAQTSQGDVILQRQYRHGIGKVSLVLPDAYLVEKEDPSVAARRALLEQTGYEAPDWRFLMRLSPSATAGKNFCTTHCSRKLVENRSNSEP